MEIYNEKLLDLMVYTSVCDYVTTYTILLIQLFFACTHVPAWLLSRAIIIITVQAYTHEMSSIKQAHTSEYDYRQY